MLFFVVVASYSLKDIYFRVYLSVLRLVALHYLVAAWVLTCVIYAVAAAVGLLQTLSTSFRVHCTQIILLLDAMYIA
jgi:hypothetical protein